MAYNLSAASRKELEGVKPELIEVVKLAIKTTTQDFVVKDGTRTKAEQKEFVRRKVSKTMKSRHLVQKDGLGYAVDLVPWINKQARWEWGAIWPIAMAMSKAAKELNVRIIWGGVWDRTMDEYPSATIKDLKAEVERYKIRHPGSDFIDGPHYELKVLPK